MLLACLGVYSVLTAAVQRRTPEFAVRLALGATPGGLARTVLGQGLRAVVAGLVVGIGAGIGVAAAVASLLFGVTPYDPAVVLVVIGIILSIATAACLTPAARATRTDPMIALRRV